MIRYNLISNNLSKNTVFILSDFFQIGPTPADQMVGFYNLGLVFLSYLVATFASYVALDITGRLHDVGNSKMSLGLWLLGGSFAMGAGIWSMHFIGMLAFSMPDMTITFDIFWTSLSLIVAILASGFAFLLLKSKTITVFQLMLGGVLLGIAIASMHYLGMQSMKEIVNIHYLPSLFILSILIAIFASEAAIYLALKSNKAVVSKRFRLKFISAFVMGFAICGMHYMGMAAAIFTPKNNFITYTTSFTTSLNPEIIAIIIASITFIILAIATFISTNKAAENQRLLLNARRSPGNGIVKENVFYNAENALNKLNISITLLTEQISDSKLNNLKMLSEWMEIRKADLPTLIIGDGQGLSLAEYITMLSLEWEKDKSVLIQETRLVVKNIEQIKNIISMQEKLNKTKN